MGVTRNDVTTYNDDENNEKVIINAVDNAPIVGVQDDNYSNTLDARILEAEEVKNNGNSTFSYLRSTMNFPDREQLFTKTYRFGHFLKNTISIGREFLFFTKPELYIIQTVDDLSSGQSNGSLVPGLSKVPFWTELANNRYEIINQLQRSTTKDRDPFNHLLQNTVNSNLDIPTLSADYVDSAANSYGVNMSYRSSSESSDDSPEFSLEFRDNKWLDVFYYFKAYDEYEVAKHHGLVGPYKDYIINKILHDQIAIYKFITDDDMETILYYGKVYGATPKNVPREVFSSPNWDSGITYSVDFKASFYEEMKPDIISDFNALSSNTYNSQPYRIDVYNDILQGVDRRPAKAAYIEKVKTNRSSAGFVYKLRWRGSDKI